ncbi:MAG: hypothetical protein LBG74_02625 [Spirochaetaceae bacterium]|nr:hypothetical protein [Spirochaetaceae bacterium]
MKTAFLIIFSIASFFMIFVVAAFAFFLHLWVEFAASVPARTSIGVAGFIPALRWAIPFALYLGILLTMNYAFRRRANGFVTFILVSVLFCGQVIGANIVVDKLAAVNVPPIALRGAGTTLGTKGLILHTADTAIILLDKTDNNTGSRVVSIPDEPLIYQKEPRGADGEIISLPSVPFNIPQNLLFDSIRVDFALSAYYMRERFNAGIIPFLMWASSLVLLQVAVSFIFNIGIWPLANLFFGALLLRGILAFEVFINSSEVQFALIDFARGLLPDSYISPFIFGTLAALMLVYVILLRIARGPRHA